MFPISIINSDTGNRIEPSKQSGPLETMWDLSSLAQKAKEAVATIESEINDSVGYVDTEVIGVSSLLSPAVPDNNETDDYFKVEEEEEIAFSEAEPSESTTVNEKTHKKDDAIKDGESSGGWDQCEDVITKEKDVTSLSDAQVKIDELEKEVQQLKEELIAERDEAKLLRMTNLELEQQIRDLTEENMSLKMNMSAKDTD